MKFRYGTRPKKSCNHEWGNPTGHDNTQFCEKCGQWRTPIINQEKDPGFRSFPVVCYHPLFHGQKRIPFAHDGKNLIYLELKDVRAEDILVTKNGPSAVILKRQLEQFKKILRIGHYPDPKSKGGSE